MYRVVESLLVTSLTSAAAAARSPALQYYGVAALTENIASILYVNRSH